MRFYLGEEPLLAAVRTFDLQDAAQRDEVLDRLGEFWAAGPCVTVDGGSAAAGPSAPELDA